MTLKDHEKFFAFLLLGGALVALAIMLYIKPIPDSTTNSGVLQILNMIIGALIGGFGSAVQALFRASDKVTVDNSSTNPVPTETTDDRPE